ncbi:putative protein OS=Streptomyces glaucescens OX=1907 GN=SGLAU_01705 PE=4 SV=1 [Streptomyces glaucescens]
MITAAPGAVDQARLRESAHRLVAQARELGLTDQELLALVRSSLACAPAPSDGTLP